jgi:hypothetical protein
MSSNLTIEVQIKLNNKQNIFFTNIFFFNLNSKAIRETLKEQMEQRNILAKKDQERKSLEFKFVSEQDRQAIEDDRKKKVEKHKYLSKFRDVNKAVKITKIILKFLAFYLPLPLLYISIL